MTLKISDLIFDSRDNTFGIIYAIEQDTRQGHNCYKVFWTCNIESEETDKSIKTDQYNVYESD